MDKPSGNQRWILQAQLGLPPAVIDRNVALLRELADLLNIPVEMIEVYLGRAAGVRQAAIAQCYEWHWDVLVTM